MPAVPRAVIIYLSLVKSYSSAISYAADWIGASEKWTTRPAGTGLESAAG